MADSGDHRFEEAWYDDLYHCDFVKFESSTWARNEGQPGEGRMVRGETRRIELKKNSITRLHQLEAESAGETRNEFQAVRVGFQGLPDELYVLWSSTPHPPSNRNYWQEHNDLRIVAEARALACKAGQLLVAVSTSKGIIDTGAPPHSSTLIDTYVSEQWRICGGAPSKQLREELRDRLILVVIEFFGSVDASLDVLLKESPYSNGCGINNLIRAYGLYCLRMKREAVEAHDIYREQFWSEAESAFQYLQEFECTNLGPKGAAGSEVHAILRTDFCRLPAGVEPSSAQCFERYTDIRPPGDNPLSPEHPYDAFEEAPSGSALPHESTNALANSSVNDKPRTGADPTAASDHSPQTAPESVIAVAESASAGNESLNQSPPAEIVPAGNGTGLRPITLEPSSPHSGQATPTSDNFAPNAESPQQRGPEPERKDSKIEQQLTAAEGAQQTRAKTVARLIGELDCLRPQMFEDEKEYDKLRAQYPDFLVFKIAHKRPDLKQKILAIRASTRHILLAQELAAAHHGRAVATIQDAWKDYKPGEFKNTR